MLGVLQSDLQDVLLTFVYTNLAAMMNPASSVVVTTTNITNITSSNGTIVITPEVLMALKPYVLNNFSDLGLPQDIQDIVRQFFAINTSVS